MGHGVTITKAQFGHPECFFFCVIPSAALLIVADVFVTIIRCKVSRAGLVSYLWSNSCSGLSASINSNSLLFQKLHIRHVDFSYGSKALSVI